VIFKSLPRIAARVLHNTHVAPSRLKDKFNLIELAYGRYKVEQDFELWCKEQKEKGLNPRYPLTEYIKTIDERLGGGFVEPSQSQFDVADSQILPISSLSYDKTGYLPPPKVISLLLKTFTQNEILEALNEYILVTEGSKDWKQEMKHFFTEGGASAVIYARRQRKE
jgi:hypothetical protein